MRRLRTVCYVGGMVRVFILFFLFFICALNAKPVFGLDCASSFRVIMECDETHCSKGFIVLLTDGICEHPYRFEEATQEGLQNLYGEDIRPSDLDFSNRKPKEKGVYERGGYSNNYEPKKTEFKSLEEARQYWLSEKFMSSVYSWFWFCVDAVIFFIALVTLYLSIKDFRVRYLYGQVIRRKPIIWQGFVWLYSWFPFFLVTSLYETRLTALLFLIVPVLWIVEILALAVYALRRKFNQQESGSPSARG